MNQRWHNSLLVFLSLILSPVVLILLFLHPSTDDYCLSAFIRDQGWAWTQHFVYTEWGGRFTSTFLLSLDPMVYGSLWGYRLMSLLLMALMLISIYRVVNLLFVSTESRNQETVTTLFLFLLLFLLQPSAVEAWYWYASSYTYQLSLVFLLWAFPGLWSFALKPNDTAFPFVSTLMFMLNMAMNETIMVVQVVLLLLFVFVAYQNKAGLKSSYLLWLLFLAGVLGFTIMAPGNFNRGEGTLVRITPWLAGWLALNTWWTYVWQWLIIALPAAFIFRMYTLGAIRTEKFTSLPLKMKVGLLLFFLALSGLPVFTIYVVANYDPPERIMNISAFFFMIAMLFLVFVLPAPVTDLKSKSMALLTLFVLLMLIRPNAWMQLSTELLSGEASSYHEEMLAREEALKSCEDCLLLPLRNRPSAIFYRELNEEPGKWPNDCYAEYYGKRSVGLRRDVNRSVRE